jgi:hypothetical protein
MTWRCDDWQGRAFRDEQQGHARPTNFSQGLVQDEGVVLGQPVFEQDVRTRTVIA